MGVCVLFVVVCVCKTHRNDKEVGVAEKIATYIWDAAKDPKIDTRDLFQTIDFEILLVSYLNYFWAGLGTH